MHCADEDNSCIGAGLAKSCDRAAAQVQRRGGAREKNVGWRLDYVLASPMLDARVEEAVILNDIFGSDHCPVGIHLA